jgi:hypothetical protein
MVLEEKNEAEALRKKLEDSKMKLGALHAELETARKQLHSQQEDKWNSLKNKAEARKMKLQRHAEASEKALLACKDEVKKECEAKFKEKLVHMKEVHELQRDLVCAEAVLDYHAGSEPKLKRRRLSELEDLTENDKENVVRRRLPGSRRSGGPLRDMSNSLGSAAAAADHDDGFRLHPQNLVEVLLQSQGA